MDLPAYSDVLKESNHVITQCFTQFKIDEVFLSFNGGKDCTALLDIVINILKDLYHSDDIAKRLKVVYIRTNTPFMEIEEFVNQTENYYGLKLTVTEGEMKTTLEQILERDETLKACLMGTRRTDPHSEHLKFMQETDPSWPQILRISPLLNWSYHQIWHYILDKNVPYCRLYDEGYTSIGSVINTWPNPALLSHKDDLGRLAYLPAWRLTDSTLERAGRGTKPIQTIDNKDPCRSENSMAPVNICNDVSHTI